MSHALKCPNPSCPFLFDPTQVPPGAVLTCPRCGMRFTLGPAGPPAVNAAPPAPAATAGPPSDAHRPTNPDGGSPVLVTFAVVGIVAAACAAGLYVLNQDGSGPAGRPGAAYEVAEFNFAYDMPGPPWEKDPAPAAAARANLFALHRTEGEAHAAFGASKFDAFDPQPGDLREPLLDRLRGLFDDPDLTEQKGATWAGRPAVKYTFRGVGKGSPLTYAGEAYAIGYKGIGYWYVGWAAEREVVAMLDEFADLRGRFRLLDYREDWKGTSSPATVFPGEAVDYRIIDADRWWKKAPAEPKDEHPKADLVLWAEYHFKKKQDVKPRAELVTYVLDPVGDVPAAAVRALIRDRYAKEAELFGPTRVAELTDEPQGDPPARTEPKGIETVRLRADSQRDPNRSKLHVIAGITVGGKVVGVEARCPLAERGLWERRLIQIAGSLRPGR